MKKTLISSLLICSLVLMFFSSLAYPAKATDFQPGFVISDYDLLNYTSMNLEQIQKFLESKNSYLATYSTYSEQGEFKTAAEIIYEEALENKINPKFLLVMLQKEQSLIEDNDPKQSQLDWAMGYGVCDNCSTKDPKVLMFKGFGIQVDRGAGVQRWYIDNKHQNWLKQAGKTYNIDGQTVSIENQATANLYNFTPHIHGNYLFWKIWNHWFSQKYPNSTLLKVNGEKTIWLIQDGFKRPFSSKATALSYFGNLDKIITVNSAILDQYETGKTIAFPNYSLVSSPEGNIFLLVNDKRRGIISWETFKTLGFNPQEIVKANWEDINLYPEGKPITLESSYPAGALLQDNKTGGVYFVQDGKKAPILTKDFLTINFPQYKITSVSSEELEKYEIINSVKLPNGELVSSKKSPAVYFISDGKKLPISSAEIFEGLGFKWEHIKTVESRTLSNLKTGPHLTLEYIK